MHKVLLYSSENTFSDYKLLFRLTVYCTSVFTIIKGTRTLQLVFYSYPGVIYIFSCVCAGDIEIGLMERNGGLEVEVVQARGLTMKPGSKTPPGESPEADRTHVLKRAKRRQRSPKHKCDAINAAHRHLVRQKKKKKHTHYTRALRQTLCEIPTVKLAQ